MNQERFETLLNTLRPKTLACMLVDLEEAAEDWEYYPEAAPCETVQVALERVRLTILTSGQAQAKSEGVNFETLVDQIHSERDSDDWLPARNQQDRQNWYQDYR